MLPSCGGAKLVRFRLAHAWCAVSSLVVGMPDSIAGKHVAESLPGLAVEFHKLHLFDRKKVVWTGIYLDAGQQHVAGDVFQVGRLPHDVFPRQVVATLLE